jgi:hypothetical protein
VRSRQAGGMKQDSAGTRKSHTHMRRKNNAKSGSTAEPSDGRVQDWLDFGKVSPLRCIAIGACRLKMMITY